MERKGEGMRENLQNMKAEMSLVYYVKWKNPNTKDHTFYDSIYIKCPERSSLWRQRMGMHMGMGLTVNEHEGSSWSDENFLRPHYGNGCTTRETYWKMNNKLKVGEFYVMHMML